LGCIEKWFVVVLSKFLFIEFVGNCFEIGNSRNAYE
jgi:hypothetical protein